MRKQRNEMVLSMKRFRSRFRSSIWPHICHYASQTIGAGLQYLPRNMHTVFALLCFVVVIHWLIFPYPPGLLRWHFGNLTIAPVPAKQPWWIWINTSCEIIMNDYITTTKQSTTKPCPYLLGYTVPCYWLTESMWCSATGIKHWLIFVHQNLELKFHLA